MWDTKIWINYPKIWSTSHINMWDTKIWSTSHINIGIFRKLGMKIIKRQFPKTDE